MGRVIDGVVDNVDVVVADVVDNLDDSRNGVPAVDDDLGPVGDV